MKTTTNNKKLGSENGGVYRSCPMLFCEKGMEFWMLRNGTLSGESRGGGAGGDCMLRFWSYRSLDCWSCDE